MLEGRNHRYEPIQMPALPSETRGLSLRGHMSWVPWSAQAQSTQRVTRQTRRPEAKIVARAGVGANHALRRELKRVGPEARLPHAKNLHPQ